MNILLAGNGLWQWVLPPSIEAELREREREREDSVKKNSRIRGWDADISCRRGVGQPCTQMEEGTGAIWTCILRANTRATGGGQAFELVGKSNINILGSFYYKDDTVTKAIPYLNRFMLDSGAFTFFTKGSQGIKWEDYTERYGQYIKQNNIKLFFELDIDCIIGYENVLKLRERLVKITGKQPIPVWHKSRGRDDFIKMCQRYSYVALGGLAAKEIRRNEYRFIPWFIDTAHRYGAKIHGLGFTNLEGLRKYHFDSVDSTAWVSGNRFGAIYKFNGRTMLKFNVPPGHKLSDARVVALNNFTEWVKFCKYAEQNL